MQVSDPLSDQLPHLDLMIRAIENERYETLFEHFAELDQIFGVLYTTYIDELQYLAVDDPQNKVAEKIGAVFYELRPSIATLRNELSLGEYLEALEQLQILKSHTQKLFALFESFKRESEGSEIYSEVPYTQELLRVCHHFLNKKLSAEAVQGRLEIFCQYHEHLENQVINLLPSPMERPIFEERLPDLEEALSLQLQAIEDLDLALERNEESSMREAMLLLEEAAEALVEVYRSLQKADLEAPSISCIRCGADNSLEAKICGQCAAVLPQAAGMSPPVSTIALEEDGSTVASQESEEVLKLQSLVDQALLANDTSELSQALLEYEKRLARNRRQFERLESPPADLPSEQAGLLWKARDTFALALGELERGLALLQEGAEHFDLGLLQSGMDQIRLAESNFRDFQVQFKEAESLSQGE